MKKMIVTKLGTLVLLLVALLVVGIQKTDAKSYNQHFSEETLAERIQRLNELSTVSISFDAMQAQAVKVPELIVTNYSLTEVLEKTLKNTGYSYQLKNGSYIIYKDDTNAPKGKAKNGKVRGTVLDENGEFLPGASVSTIDGKQGTVTNGEGKFSLELPAGTYTLEVSYIGYQAYQITDVKVRNGKSTPLDIKLEDLSNQLSEVVVTAHYNQASAEGLYARQKAVASMSDGVSADLIKKTSDSNVAQVLKRVSGVTIDKGKYVIVRGMGERYNNVQLNGASLPSTEPNRRNFSFDVISSNMVDNITIAKTFTPDLPAEFTGGLVQINTIAIPTERIFKIGIGTGYDTFATGKKFLSGKRHDSDYFLGEIDKRQWYVGHSEEQVKQNKINAGNQNTYGLKQYTGQPKQSYNLTCGMPFQIGKNKLGIVAGLTYKHNESREKVYEGRLFNNDSITSPGNKYTFVTTAGATLNMGWHLGNHKITLRNLFNNRFTHKNSERYTSEYYNVNIVSGSKKEGISKYEQYSVPLRSQLYQSQMDGEHKLFNQKIDINWHASYNKINRTNPDDRLVQGAEFGESNNGKKWIGWYPSVMESPPSIEENHTMYSDLIETKKNLGVDISYSFEVLGNKQKVKAGYLGSFRDADFEQEYLLAEQDGLPDILSDASLERLFAPENFEKGFLHYKDSPLDGYVPSYYTGDRRINAIYAMGEFSFLKKFRLVAGARLEHNSTETSSRKSTARIGKSIWVDTTYFFKKEDILPAATLVYSLKPELNFRVAFSKTIARPDFREISFIEYYNVDDRATVTNSEPLSQTSINNYDARVEWYPHVGEILSLGFFYKDFTNPVEQIIRVATDQQNYELQTENLESSTAMGIELNWRKSLGFISRNKHFLDDLYFSGNFTWMNADITYNEQLLRRSHLELSEEEKLKFSEYERSRPLQGLSPYAINAGLSYNGEYTGFAVNYNRKGRTLLLAGEYEYDDLYLKPRDVLDLQFTARLLDKKLQLKLNVSDILQQDFIQYRNRAKFAEAQSDDVTDRTGDMDYNEGDWVSLRSRKGIVMSLSATYTF